MEEHVAVNLRSGEEAVAADETPVLLLLGRPDHLLQPEPQQQFRRLQVLGSEPADCGFVHAERTGYPRRRPSLFHTPEDEPPLFRRQPGVALALVPGGRAILKTLIQSWLRQRIPPTPSGLSNSGDVQVMSVYYRYQLR